MRLSIIVEDKIVVLNGKPLSFDFTIDPDIWAIQWYGNKGSIELVDGKNKSIDDIDEFTYIIESFHNEEDRLNQKMIDDESSAILAMTYVDHRRKNYPSIGDQLDMMYHDKIDNTTTWVDSIAAVKLLYPKT